MLLQYLPIKMMLKLYLISIGVLLAVPFTGAAAIPKAAEPAGHGDAVGYGGPAGLFGAPWGVMKEYISRTNSAGYGHAGDYGAPAPSG